MAKIRFEDGTVVNFEGDPTPEDVDYVAQQLKIKPTSTTNTPNSNKPKEDYAMLTGKGLADIIPGLAYAAQYYQNLGNIPKAEEGIKPFEALQGQSVGGKLAQAAPTALGRLPFYMYGGGAGAQLLGRPIVGGALGFGGVGGLEQVLQGQPEQAPRAALTSALSYPVLHGMGRGANVLPTETLRRAATGAGFGGFSAGQSALSGGTPTDILTDTILGVGLGAGFKPKPQGEYLARKVAKLEKSAVETYRKTLGVKSHELKNVEIRKGGNIDDAFKVMADENIPLSQTPDGWIDTTQARNTIKTRIDGMSTELENFLKRDVSTKFDLNDIANKAKKVVEERATNAQEAADAKADIDNYMQSEKYRYGKNVDGSIIPAESVDAFTLNRIKQGMWSVGYDQMKPTRQSNARKIGRAIAETLNNKYPNSPIQKLNNRMSDYLTALNILETPRKSQTGGIGAGAARVTGAMIGGMAGSPLPVLGTAGGGAAGYALGGKVYEMMKSPKRQATAASKKMTEAQKIQMLNPEVREILKNLLKNRGVK